VGVAAGDGGGGWLLYRSCRCFSFGRGHAGFAATQVQFILCMESRSSGRGVRASEARAGRPGLVVGRLGPCLASSSSPSTVAGGAPVRMISPYYIGLGVSLLPPPGGLPTASTWSSRLGVHRSIARAWLWTSHPSSSSCHHVGQCARGEARSRRSWAPAATAEYFYRGLFHGCGALRGLGAHTIPRVILCIAPFTELESRTSLLADFAGDLNFGARAPCPPPATRNHARVMRGSWWWRSRMMIGGGGPSWRGGVPGARGGGGVSDRWELEAWAHLPGVEGPVAGAAALHRQRDEVGDLPPVLLTCCCRRCGYDETIAAREGLGARRVPH